MIRVAQFSDLHYSGKNLSEADVCFGYSVDEAIRRGVGLAVISGDSTDRALDMHSPAVVSLARQVRRLADHCPVLMLQGTFSHEPPGTLSIFRLLGGVHKVHVADRIAQVALLDTGGWVESDGWRFDAIPESARVLITCLPTVNKAAVAAAVGATEAGEAVGHELAALLRGYAAINRAASRTQMPTVVVSHGTVTGCVTEHGVPMAGFDHEFTTGALFAAEAQAVMLGHIHRHQHWSQERRLVAYPGSIGRFHHGEQGEKGFLVWEVGATGARLELVATPARRTVDLFFDGKPDLGAIEVAAREQRLQGAHVRVRWTVADEDRHEVDRAAIQRALEGAADVQLEGRIVPVVRSRAEGISRCASLAGKVRAWAHVTGAHADPLMACLDRLTHQQPEAIANEILAHATASRASTGDLDAPETNAVAPHACSPAAQELVSAEPTLF